MLTIKEVRTAYKTGNCRRMINLLYKYESLVARKSIVELTVLWDQQDKDKRKEKLNTQKIKVS